MATGGRFDTDRPPAMREPAMSIDELRARMDALDAELLGLLARRAELSTAIARAKRAQNLPPRDPERENELVARARALAQPPLTPEAAETCLRAALDACRAVATAASAPVPEPCRVAIVGLGLICGSLARALKRAQPAHRLTGVDVADRLEAPRASGLFESLHLPEDGAAAVAGADVVFLCAAPRVNLRLMAEVRKDAAPQAVVSDVGGIKADICRAGRRLFDGRQGPWFIGGHPMAGRAQGGFAASGTDLFSQRPWVLTPRHSTPLEPLRRLQGLIESTGAHLALLTPEDHDRTVVAVSHLPQLLALGLMLCVGGRDRGMAGPALRDMTRLAHSPPALWNELFRARSELVMIELQRLRSYLSDLEMAVAFGEDMTRFFARAASLRDALDSVPVAPAARGA